MSESRDWWAKTEIITKIISSIAAVFLPIALLIVGNQLTEQQKKSEDLRQQAENRANRLPKLIEQLSSSNPTEKKLSVQVAVYLANQGQLPKELVPVLVAVANTDNNDVVRSEVRSSLINLAEQQPSLAPEINAELSTLVYIQIANENQREKAKVIQSDLIKNGFSAPGIENVGDNVGAKPKILDITEVRYFRNEDKTQVGKIKKILKSNGINTFREVETSGTVKQIEIWFSLGL
jgi:hypothetical protein